MATIAKGSISLDLKTFMIHLFNRNEN